MNDDRIHRELSKRLDAFEDALRDHKKHFHSHTIQDRDSFGAINRNIESIKDNHLHHIEKDVARNANDLEWLKKTFWIVAASSIGALVTALLNLIIGE